MEINTKQGYVEVPQKWLDVWYGLYWKDDVDLAVHKCYVWTECSPDRKTTKRGLRRRLNVFMKDARLKPKIRLQAQSVLPVITTTLETRSSFLKDMKEKVGL